MPVQKGKKRKRARRHSLSDEIYEATPESPVEEQPKARAPRRGFFGQTPLAVNLAFGIFMLGMGTFFFVTKTGGGNFLLLVLYLLLGGFYLWRAFRQYRARGQI